MPRLVAGFFTFVCVLMFISYL